MSSSLPSELHRAVAAWMEQDPDPATRAEVERLLTAVADGDPAALAELEDAFAGRLEFGTAGLRGALGPGPNRMNRVVVGQAAAGLARYLLDQGQAGGRVIVGYDARHNSQAFARDTAEIMAGAGFEALLTSHALPTPVVAYGIGHLDCVAGIVVTASHNPPQDNGYKVYLGDGSQIVPPADAAIAEQILETTKHGLDDVPQSDGYALLGSELVDAYVERVVGLVPAAAPRELSWVYTPLHGVGGSLVERVVGEAGFPAPVVVAEQAEPDPDFPTVAFPNPEEPGAIDLALARAVQVGADLVLANDPDADRCAVAVPVDGRWRMLHGDELGALLGDDALRRGVRGTYACSIVSSTLLAAMAAAYGQPFRSTLTGFKWIGRVPGLAFGYEEAIGYCVDPTAVPDKDGVSALLRVLVIAAELKAAGRTIADRLDEITAAYGVYLTDQLSVRVDDPSTEPVLSLPKGLGHGLSEITTIMERLRAAPPTRLIDEDVSAIDLAAGSAQLPPTDAVMVTGPSLKVVVRPSGTEPKLKCYLEVRRPVTSSSTVRADRERARDALVLLRAEMSAALGLTGG